MAQKEGRFTMEMKEQVYTDHSSLKGVRTATPYPAFLPRLLKIRRWQGLATNKISGR